MRLTLASSLPVFAFGVVFVVVFAVGAPSLAHRGIDFDIDTSSTTLEGDPDDAEAWLRRADALHRVGLTHAARLDVGRALELDAMAVGGWLLLAEIASSEHDWPSARQAFDTAHGLGAGAAALLGRARALAALGETRAADEDFARGLALAPNLEGFLAWGRLRKTTDGERAAATVYEAGLGALGDAVLLRRAAVQSLLAAGDAMRALALLTPWLAGAGAGEAKLWQARALVQLGDSVAAQAIRHDCARNARAALARKPTALAHLRLAEILAELGDHDAASSEARAALALAPTWSRANELLAKLTTKAPIALGGESR